MVIRTCPNITSYVHCPLFSCTRQSRNIQCILLLRRHFAMVQLQHCFPLGFPTTSLISLGPDTSLTQDKTLVHCLTWTALLSNVHPQIPRHFAWHTLAVNLTNLTVILPPITSLQLLDKQKNTGTSTALITVIQLYAYTNSPTLPTCGISLISLTLPVPEAGEVLE
jgi:hypothetical protein